MIGHQIDVVDEVLSITLERDTQRDQMLTGGYVTTAAIRRGGKFMVSCFLTLTPLNLTKHYCRICKKADYVIDTGTIHVRNRWPGSVTGVAWHGWSMDWCARGLGINSGGGSPHLIVSVSNEGRKRKSVRVDHHVVGKCTCSLSFVPFSVHFVFVPCCLVTVRLLLKSVCEDII